MVKKMKNYVCAIMLVLATIAAQVYSPMLVKAADAVYTTTNGVVDLKEGDGSIRVIGNEGQSLTGKKFQIYQLFYAENAEGLESIQYTLNETYADVLKAVVGAKLKKDAKEVTEYEIIDYMQSMNSDIQEGAQADQELESAYSAYRYFVEEVTTELAKEGISGMELEVKDTKADNSIEVKGLLYGYYLIEDVSDLEGEHAAVSMSMLSTANPKSSMHVKADYPTVTKKIQEDDNRNTIGDSGWNDIGDFEIGQNVPYRYTSQIPNMNGYQSYYYAWHDVMDEALTLQQDSIQITLEGKVGSASKKYQLQENEYKLILDKEDATFVIEVADVKKIVDREFPNHDEKNENSYGQKVTVTYQATLNEKAALDTGAPGFENDVRLEFSNDPNQNGTGETGFTPWDTVVCYTYQLNGLKMNNYKANLEGAVFKLYRDEQCEEEVYVKRSGNRYVVMHPDSWTEIPEEAEDIVSDANGEFDICGLDGGIYYLKEITAPTGYRPLLDPVKIEIAPVYNTERNNYMKGEGGQIVELSATATVKTFQNGGYSEKKSELETDEKKGSMNLSVVNETGKKLPITGSSAMPVLIVVGVILMGASIKKGSRKHE